MSDNPQNEVYGLDNMPADVDEFLSTGRAKEFTPLEDETYQVEIKEMKLQANKFWKPPTEEERKEGKGFDKYNFSITFIILDEGEFRGRRVWDNAGLSLKPTTKRGSGPPTKLYKIISKALQLELDWDEVNSFAPDTKTLYTNILNEVVGKQIRVTIESMKNVETGKTRVKVVSYSAAKKVLASYDPDENKGDQSPRPTDQIGGEEKSGDEVDDLSEDVPF